MELTESHCGRRSEEGGIHMTDSHTLPWAPISPGLSFKALHLDSDDSPWVLLLRIEPGTVVPRHRHTGPTHVFNISGHRKLQTGEVVGPGGYVYEPRGHVDTWSAVGDEPVVVHAVVEGAVEYLDEDGAVIRRSTATTARDSYRRHCESIGVAA